MGLDSVEIIVGIENAFKIRIPDSVAAKIVTPRDLVLYVSSVIEIQPSKVCQTQQIFYALRRKFPNTRAWFKPQTRLLNLCDARAWQQVWTEVRFELNSNAPEQLPSSIFGLEVRTVRELVFWVAEGNCAKTKTEIHTRETVALTIRQIVFEVTGARCFSIDAQFVRDLGLN